VRLVEPGKLKIVVNTADDLTVGDIYVCPDIDTVLYTLAGLIDQERWYGIQGDTHAVHAERLRAGMDDLLRIGDRDRENAEFRTALLQEGRSLSSAVSQQRERLGIRQEVWPMTDSKVTTMVKTPSGVKPFQEFWVKGGGRDEILDVTFEGIEGASISPEADAALATARLVIIGPSNPISSIGPILATRGMLPRLKNTKVVAISPLREGAPFSGPAGKMLLAKGYEVSPHSIAKIYGGFLDELVLDRSDAQMADEIAAKQGIKVTLTQTEMRTPEDKFKFAQTALGAETEGETNG
jgi:LPPG:FO 2-phospho-L-lactate transferase